MQITFKHRCLPMALAVLLLCTAGMSCQSEEEKARLTQAEKRARFVEDSLALKVGILPTADCDAIRLAGELGLFDSLGVDVHLKHYNALSECRHALRMKLVEGAVIDSVLADVIQTKDSTALVLAEPTSLSWKLIASRKARVMRTSQLVDKIIAADSHGATHSMAEAVVDTIQRKGKQAFVVQVEDPRVRYDMLCVGNVDAAYLPEPFAAMALKGGNRLLEDRTKEPKGVIALRKKALEDARIVGQYKAFLRAIEIAEQRISH